MKLNSLLSDEEFPLKFLLLIIDIKQTLEAIIFDVVEAISHFSHCLDVLSCKESGTSSYCSNLKYQSILGIRTMIDVKVTKSNNDATKNVKQSYNLQQELLNCLLRDGLRFLIKITSLIRSENSSSVLSSILSYQYYTCSDSSNDDHRMRISSILLELISSAGLNYELTKSMNCWLICGIYGILDALVSHFKALNFTREISHFPEMLFIRTYRKQQVWAEEGVGQRSLPPGCLKEKQFRKSFGQDTISNEMRITSHAVQRSSTEDCISSLWLTSSPPNLYRQLEMV